MKRCEWRRPRRALGIEALEDRRLLSADLTGGVLTVNGTKKNDSIEVGVDGANLSVTLNGESELFNLADVAQVHINGLGGKDTITVGDEVLINCWISGGTGNDHLDGGGGDDVMHGDQGKDTVEGDSGNDELYGDNSKDVLEGDEGDDELDGGNGKDECLGGAGNDTLRGGRGKDHLDGEDGEDVLDGDEGSDFVASGLVVDLETEFKAPLTGSSGASGKAEFEIEDEHCGVEVELAVEVKDAAANTTYDVFVDGVLVGQITTDEHGKGELEFTSRPEEGEEQGFPEGFPEIGAGTTVVVGDILTGTFAAWVETEFEAELSGTAGASGEAEFEVEQLGDVVVEKEFKVEVENAAPDTTYDVWVGGVLVGQLTTDAEGHGELKFSNETDDDDDDDETPLPDGFPEIGAGTTVVVGDILTGTFAVEEED